MKVEKVKKLTKKQVLEEERSARRRKINERAKWTPQYARAQMENMDYNNYLKRKAFEEAWKKGNIWESSSDTTDEEEIVRVCQSPDKNIENVENTLDGVLAKRAKQRLFPKHGQQSASKSYVVLAVDTMEVDDPQETNQKTEGRQ